MWVFQRDKSPPIEVSISKFGPKLHLSTVKAPFDFGIDWPWSSVSFSISNLCFYTKFCVSYSFASGCIYLVTPSPVNAPHSTGHCTYTKSYMHVDRVPPWTVKQSSFISWRDHRSSMSLRRLGDWHRLDFTSSYRFSPDYTHLKPLSHQGGVLTATARRARKTQNAELRAVRSPRAPRDRRGIAVASPLDAVGSPRTPCHGAHFAHAQSARRGSAFPRRSEWAPCERRGFAAATQ